MVSSLFSWEKAALPFSSASISSAASTMTARLTVDPFMPFPLSLLARRCGKLPYLS